MKHDRCDMRVKATSAEHIEGRIDVRIMRGGRFKCCNWAAKVCISSMADAITLDIESIMATHELLLSLWKRWQSATGFETAVNTESYQMAFHSGMSNPTDEKRII